MPKRDPLLLRLVARIGDADFTEAYIPRESGRDVYGLWMPDGSITVNPIPHTVDTIIHELLHDLKPAWSERYVRSVTTRLLKSISEDELQTIYGEYRKRARQTD
jgi:hypothetical protein